MAQHDHTPALETVVHAVNEAPAALKFGPAAAVNALSLGGVPLDQWVYLITLIWLLLQIGGWIWDRWNRRKEAKDE